jgi:DNA (cytosine-5)-methyltransferase 1
VRPPVLRLHEDELIVDSFAGGGGASTGIEMALGRSPDIAVNHDPEALAMHEENHPGTRHFCESVWDVDPAEVTRGKRVGLAWFSPDCKHFSRAKGGKPVDKKIRSLAWVVTRWARAVRPRVILLENVPEFQDWGPLLPDGSPDWFRRGLTFRRWVGQLRAAGYQVEARQLRACDYGAPTSRTRLFIVARCDGEPIVWPEPTHGPGLLPYRTASEIIDWSIPAPSIFERERPLAEATLRRIARGIQQYVIDDPAPFVAPSGGSAATMIQRSWGEREGQAPRIMDVRAPLGTIVAGGVKHALVLAFLAKHYTGVTGSRLAAPIGTITAVDHHSLVTAFLSSYYGAGVGQPLSNPLRTITTKDRFGLVTVRGEQRAIEDIGMRMLVPPELFRGQGFPSSYRIDVSASGKPITKTAQVRMVGNSVSPPVAKALVRAQFADTAFATEAA